MSYGLYIHVPFCRTKCPYCAFASVTGGGRIMERYCTTVARELELRCRGPFGRNPGTIYIGGGTPSLLPPSLISTVLADVSLSDTVEFTVEANPESVTPGWLDGVLGIGANRISIGVQSLDEKVLDSLGRIHTPERAVSSVRDARRAGFPSISVDLMFGVPGQTMSAWSETLGRIVELEPDHVSAYSLGIEEDTVFFEKRRNDGLDIPSPEETAEMYFLLNEVLGSNGYARYEISNFAKPGHECRHNRGYWDFTPYLGVGASAHTFDGVKRCWNERDPLLYMRRIEETDTAVTGSETIDESTRGMEELMLSLRTGMGFDFGKIRGANRTAEEKILDFVSSGLLRYRGDATVVLTDRGAVVADEIIAEIACEYV